MAPSFDRYRANRGLVRTWVASAGGGLTVFALMIAAALCLSTVGSIGWVWLGGFSAIAVVALAVPALMLGSLAVQIIPPRGGVAVGEAAPWAINVRRSIPLPVAGIRLRVCDDEHALPAASVRHGTHSLNLVLPRRGRVDERDLRMVCSFPFGLWTLERRIRLVRDVIARPAPSGCELRLATGMSVSARMIGTRASAHGDILGIRDYVRGDAPRQIAWPATARLGRLMSRQCGGAAECQVIVDLDEAAFAGAAVDPESGYEYAIRTVASIVAAWTPADGPMTVRFSGHVRSVTKAPQVDAALDALGLLPFQPSIAHKIGRPAPGAWAILVTAEGETTVAGYDRILRFSRGVISDDAAASAIRSVVIQTRSQWHDAVQRLGALGASHVN